MLIGRDRLLPSPLLLDPHHQNAPIGTANGILWRPTYIFALAAAIGRLSSSAFAHERLCGRLLCADAVGLPAW